MTIRRPPKTGYNEPDQEREAERRQVSRCTVSSIERVLSLALEMAAGCHWREGMSAPISVVAIVLTTASILNRSQFPMRIQRSEWGGDRSAQASLEARLADERPLEKLQLAGVDVRYRPEFQPAIRPPHQTVAVMPHADPARER